MFLNIFSINNLLEAQTLTVSIWTSSKKNTLKLRKLNYVVFIQQLKNLYFIGFLARPEGFEPTTLGLENRCSIQLS
tara:strand:+ start:2145 stop:2372 length:228 start_codon:yes stop_codon:yes gene_type:complete